MIKAEKGEEPDLGNEVYEMSMMQAVKSVFGKYASFRGRARRKEYWLFLYSYGYSVPNAFRT